MKDVIVPPKINSSPAYLFVVGLNKKQKRGKNEEGGGGEASPMAFNVFAS